MPGEKKEPLTVSAVRAEAASLGFHFRKQHSTGEYRIVPKHLTGQRAEDSAYYTTDLTDALETMRAWR